METIAVEMSDFRSCRSYLPTKIDYCCFFKFNYYFLSYRILYKAFKMPNNNQVLVWFQLDEIYYYFINDVMIFLCRI